MDDFNFLWYILAAILYFLTRSRKKKKPQHPSRPGTDNQPKNPPKSFEELLREITGEPKPEPSEPVKQEPLVVEKPDPVSLADKEEKRLEGERRMFSDEESRQIYEESIRQAEGADLTFERSEHFKQPGLLLRTGKPKGKKYTIADEIRDGLTSKEAKKAIIYSEIIHRKY